MIDRWRPEGRHRSVASGVDRVRKVKTTIRTLTSGADERFPSPGYLTFVSFSVWRNQVGVSSWRPPSAVVSTVVRRPSRAMSAQA